MAILVAPKNYQAFRSCDIFWNTPIFLTAIDLGIVFDSAAICEVILIRRRIGNSTECGDHSLMSIQFFNSMRIHWRWLFPLITVLSFGTNGCYQQSSFKPVKEPTPKPLAHVLVAGRDLDIGLKLTRPTIFFEKRAVTLWDVPKNAVRSFEEIKDKYMRQSVQKGTVVTDTDARDPDSFLFPNDWRAVSVRVSTMDVQFLDSLEGNNVDVFWTVKLRGEKVAKQQSLLENKLVMVTNRRSPLAIPMDNVITLALNDHEASMVIRAERLGMLDVRLSKHCNPSLK